MKKINFSKEILPHTIAVLVFLVVTLIFFSPVFFENKSLSQHDITQHTGIAKALRDYRNATGEEGLWAQSLFSGMPAYLVNLEWSDGPVVWMKKILTIFLPHPVNNIFLAFLSYYVLLLAFRVRPYLAIAGAIAFGLSSFIIIGLAAGHNARIGAIALMPLVLAGIHLVFSGKKILGFGVTAAALSLHLRENHLQVTYYLMLVVAGYGLMQLIVFAKAGNLKEFFQLLGVLVLAAVLAAGTFFGPLWAVSEYSHYSARGPSELTHAGKATDSEGLSKSYAFRYSFGILEPMTLMVPNFYGGSSMQSLVQDQKSATYQALSQASDNRLANQLANYASAYWGDQPLAAPYYAGAMICFLFVMGILFVERKYVAWLIPLGVLSIAMSWGSTFEGFNYFMFDYFPGYNKFRSVTFALIILLLSMPLLGMMGLEKLFQKGINKDTRRKLIIAFSLTGGVCLLLLVFGGALGFTRSGEEKLPVWFLQAIREDRAGLLRGDAFRSLAFILFIFILLFFDIRQKISEFVFCALLIFAVTIDLTVIDKRYFTKDNYQRKNSTAFFEMWESEKEVLQDKSTYRVFAENNDGRASYYFQSIGGYHGAILRRYQELMDSCIYPEIRKLGDQYEQGKNLYWMRPEIESMLNVKYYVYGEPRKAYFVNPYANGPVWFVKMTVPVKSPNEELEKLREINTKEAVVLNVSRFQISDYGYDSTSRISLVESKPPYMKYESESPVNSLAVFSEIYYPKGWHAFIDGKEVTILQADYVLRALEIPAGKHIIEFKFEPKPYIVGNKVTMASCWILLLVVLGSLGWSIRKSGP